MTGSKVSTIQFNRDFDPQYGTSVQLSPLIRRVVCQNASPFTFTGTGTYIVGKGNVAVIDPGPDDDEHLDALLKALDGETVTHIIITHTHLDHSPLAEKLKQKTAAKTYGFGPHGTGLITNTGDVRLDAGGDYDFVPDVQIRDGDVIDGGVANETEWRLESVFTPGHTSNHMCFALPQEKALFSGDHVMAWSTSIVAPPDGRMADYFTSLRKIMQREEDILWPTHGGPRKDPRPFVRAFLTHRKMREAAIERRLEKGDRTIADIVKAIYSDVDRRLHPAAAMSTMAHIQHLIEQERVATEGELSLDGEYWTV